VKDSISQEGLNAGAAEELQEEGAAVMKSYEMITTPIPHSPETLWKKR